MLETKPRTRWLVLAACLSGAVGGCQLVYGLDDYSSADGPKASGTDGATSVAVGSGGGSASASSAGGATATSTTTSGSSGGGDCDCIDAPPASWLGPYFVFPHDPLAPTPTKCPDGSSVLDDLREGPPTTSCTPCACGPVGGASCSPPIVSCYTSGACNGAANAPPSNVADGSCHYTTAMASCKQTTPAAVALPGSCAASGGQIQNNTWLAAHSVCRAESSGSSCDPGQVCLGDPAAAGAELCVMVEGIAQCPTGWDGLSIAVKKDATSDDRTCSACQCGAAAGVSCTGTYQVALACGSGKTVAAACTDVTVPFLGYAYTIDLQGEAPKAAGASCPPSGGTLSGAFDPGVDATLCCK